ncbi:hypothetical protein RND81_01G141500 [Saponaria officinalis]|uniref:Uncharacterized protein n=1 Tax=Saponaria officinalis TaxID=3572 RepID=A0AAW1NED5_SAPOF
MSSLLFLASITLVLLSILSVSTADLVVDIDGDPIVNGRNYYIIPITTTTSTSGLTYTQKQEQCPLYITKEKTENSPGIPVTISSLARTLFISTDKGVSLRFKGFSTPCLKLQRWGISIDPFGRKVYITSGSENTRDAYRFFITQKDSSSTSTYELKYGSEYNPSLGLYEDDGLLGLASNPTMVSFKKADDYLELPTTSKIN